MVAPGERVGSRGALPHQAIRPGATAPSLAAPHSRPTAPTRTTAPHRAAPLPRHRAAPHLRASRLHPARPFPASSGRACARAPRPARLAPCP
ncbi:hypothetical protein SAM23877_2061 [Streptomyces ambofaciens ATCC 23877]|uniref:Uncharacterized protein n=1 Tax=Streptomyces ambofaciens (strain ATCC 23877 / 3486 / DSM 40053 / JCM 4204 / NBRC 12836 / NRRL B-2516) TaxID=278992 RepID=A0A0K2APT6_STRA7|nr:hypothetical protein SAM23877_2061 [Streptomyces ambofaciens ATCC 23877]